LPTPAVAELIDCLSQLAALYSETKRLDRSATLLERVVQLREGIVGRDRSDATRALIDFAEQLIQRRNYQEAELLFSEAATVQADMRGKNHPEVANLYLRIAETAAG